VGAHLQARSSWARLGLNVHTTAPLIHPGHDGLIVFELHNVGELPIELYTGARVAQLWLYELPESDAQGYADSDEAKYSKVLSTGVGRLWEDPEFGILAKGKGSL
jgi:dCTP deaminase